jgi:hypothetical protein
MKPNTTGGGHVFDAGWRGALYVSTVRHVNGASGLSEQGIACRRGGAAAEDGQDRGD